MKLTHHKWLLIAVFLMLVDGCAIIETVKPEVESDDWKTTISKNNRESYEDYIRKYPEKYAKYLYSRIARMWISDSDFAFIYACQNHSERQVMSG